MTFQIRALGAAPFQDLFARSDAELSALETRRLEVASKPGYPCRISLQDAEIGETVMLVQYAHQPERSPFRASHAIIVRQGVDEATPCPEEVPELLRTRLLSARAFDRRHEMIDAEVVEGAELETAIERLLEDPKTEYLHLHNAGLGCYLARVTRTL